MSVTTLSSRKEQITATAFFTDSAILIAIQAVIGICVHHGWFWAVAALILPASHFMHGTLIAFHEASHGLLRKSRLLNEIDGVFIGIFSFTSFSLYRAAHQTHHAHLGSERDEELWPFVRTEISRPTRIFAAVLELTVGILFTPFLFYRTFLREGSPIRSRKIRRRIWMEIGGVILAWITIFSLVAYFDVWIYFLSIFALPAIVAGNLQSWRKYIEHVGLTGDTVNSSTRNVVPRTRLGRWLAFTLLHEPYHGVHHQKSGLPHEQLPEHVGDLEPRTPAELAPFPSYTSALQHLLKNLKDPRVGAQWRAIPSK